MKRLLGLTLMLWILPVTAQQLIANESAGVASVTRNEARLFLTMRLKQWPNGTMAKVFVLPDTNSLHQRFVNSVLGLYPYQLRRVWDRQLFSGTGQAPTTVESEQEMIQRVAATPGAIGYSESGVTEPGVRIVEVR